MGKVVGIENFNPRKIKAREYSKTAEDLLFGNRDVVLDGTDFFDGSKISEKLFDDSKSIYVNSNEKLITGDFVKEGDRFATVLSSGDFALDGIFHGAKEVTTFDINKNQILPAELKVKGLQKLSYDDFVSFFLDVSSDGYLSSEIYRKIKSQDGNDPLFAFWDVVMKVREQEKGQMSKNLAYSSFKKAVELAKKDSEAFKSILSLLPYPNAEEIIRNFSDVYFDQMMMRKDPYYKPSKVFGMIQGTAGGQIVEGSYIESEDSFLETRERLKKSKISFLKSDLAKLKEKLLTIKRVKGENFEGFDSIYLSNIPEYMSGQEFFGIVDEQLMPLLTEDGSIIYCCQGVDAQLLEQEKAGEQLRKEFNKKMHTVVDASIMTLSQQINDIEGYQALKENFDVSKTVMDAYAPSTGSAGTDIFVRVKKK